MLDHYTRRKDAFPPPGFPGYLRVHGGISLIKLVVRYWCAIKAVPCRFEVAFISGLQLELELYLSAMVIFFFFF